MVLPGVPGRFLFFLRAGLGLGLGLGFAFCTTSWANPAIGEGTEKESPDIIWFFELKRVLVFACEISFQKVKSIQTRKQLFFLQLQTQKKINLWHTLWFCQKTRKTKLKLESKQPSLSNKKRKKKNMLKLRTLSNREIWFALFVWFQKENTKNHDG